MKKLYLVRHADAEPSRLSGGDFDRALTTYGRQHAASLALKLKQMNISPDLIISSDAKRAQETAQILAEVLSYKRAILFENKIYHIDEKRLSDFLMMTDSKINSLLLVGHNPTLSSFAHSQALKASYSMQPASAIGLHYSVKHWSDLSPRSCTFQFYECLS